MTNLRMNQFYKTKTCPWYYKGRCERGEACRFAHNDTEKRTLPDLSRTSLCTFLVKNGTCSIPNCRFAHHVDQLRATDHMYKTSLCFMFMKSRCEAGINCRHAHGAHELRKQPAVATQKHISTSETPSTPASVTSDFYPTVGTRKNHTTFSQHSSFGKEQLSDYEKAKAIQSLSFMDIDRYCNTDTQKDLRELGIRNGHALHPGRSLSEENRANEPGSGHAVLYHENYISENQQSCHHLVQQLSKRTDSSQHPPKPEVTFSLEHSSFHRGSPTLFNGNHKKQLRVNQDLTLSTPVTASNTFQNDISESKASVPQLSTLHTPQPLQANTNQTGKKMLLQPDIKESGTISYTNDETVSFSKWNSLNIAVTNTPTGTPRSNINLMGEKPHQPSVCSLAGTDFGTHPEYSSTKQTFSCNGIGNAEGPNFSDTTAANEQVIYSQTINNVALHGKWPPAVRSTFEPTGTRDEMYARQCFSGNSNFTESQPLTSLHSAASQWPVTDHFSSCHQTIFTSTTEGRQDTTSAMGSSIGGEQQRESKNLSLVDRCAWPPATVTTLAYDAREAVRADTYNIHDSTTVNAKQLNDSQSSANLSSKTDTLTASLKHDKSNTYSSCQPLVSFSSISDGDLLEVGHKCLRTSKLQKTTTGLHFEHQKELPLRTLYSSKASSLAAAERTRLSSDEWDKAYPSVKHLKKVNEPGMTSVFLQQDSATSLGSETSVIHTGMYRNSTTCGPTLLGRMEQDQPDSFSSRESFSDLKPGNSQSDLETTSGLTTQRTSIDLSALTTGSSFQSFLTTRLDDEDFSSFPLSQMSTVCRSGSTSLKCVEPVTPFWSKRVNGHQLTGYVANEHSWSQCNEESNVESPQVQRQNNRFNNNVSDARNMTSDKDDRVVHFAPEHLNPETELVSNSSTQLLDEKTMQRPLDHDAQSNPSQRPVRNAQPYFDFGLTYEKGEIPESVQLFDFDRGLASRFTKSLSSTDNPLKINVTHHHNSNRNNANNNKNNNSATTLSDQLFFSDHPCMFKPMTRSLELGHHTLALPRANTISSLGAAAGQPWNSLDPPTQRAPENADDTDHTLCTSSSCKGRFLPELKTSLSEYNAIGGSTQRLPSNILPFHLEDALPISTTSFSPCLHTSSPVPVNYLLCPDESKTKHKPLWYTSDELCSPRTPQRHTKGGLAINSHDPWVPAVSLQRCASTTDSEDRYGSKVALLKDSGFKNCRSFVPFWDPHGLNDALPDTRKIEGLTTASTTTTTTPTCVDRGRQPFEADANTFDAEHDTAEKRSTKDAVTLSTFSSSALSLSLRPNEQTSGLEDEPSACHTSNELKENIWDTWWWREAAGAFGSNSMRSPVGSLCYNATITSVSRKPFKVCSKETTGSYAPSTTSTSACCTNPLHPVAHFDPSPSIESPLWLINQATVDTIASPTNLLMVGRPGFSPPLQSPAFDEFSCLSLRQY